MHSLYPLGFEVVVRVCTMLTRSTLVSGPLQVAGEAFAASAVERGETRGFLKIHVEQVSKRILELLPTVPEKPGPFR